MNTAFPRILTLLRKERGVSQKQVSADLQVSQALLSHYEKGIRECGLDFVVRAADYYGVSCDYLLGRTADKTGAVIAVDEIPENDPAARANPKNPAAMFSVEEFLFLPSLLGESGKATARIGRLTQGFTVGGEPGVAADKLPAILPDDISAQYPLFASSLFNLLRNAETRLKAE